MEIPIARYFIDKVKRSYIEVGAVMPYYGFEASTVIDIADPYPKSLKINALDYNYTGKNLLSISTVEHFKKDEYGNRKNNDGITFMQKVLKESKNYLVTWPLGHNLFLDAWLGASNLRFNVLTKIADENWCVVENKQLSSNYDYAKGSANAICLVTNLTELL